MIYQFIIIFTLTELQVKKVIFIIVRQYRLFHDVVTYDVNRNVSAAFFWSSSGDKVDWFGCCHKAGCSDVIDGFSHSYNQRVLILDVIEFSFTQQIYLRANISDPDNRWKCWNLFKLYLITTIIACFPFFFRNYCPTSCVS